jgi:hypothetical protein
MNEHMEKKNRRKKRMVEVGSENKNPEVKKNKSSSIHHPSSIKAHPLSLSLSLSLSLI